MKPKFRTIPVALTSLALIGQLCIPSAALERIQPEPPQGDVTITSVFPDREFQAWLLDSKNINGFGADGILTEEERQNITELNLSGLGLTSLTGLSAFPNLETLNCSNNNLTELDLSGNPSLTRLYCSYNQLAQLDLSKNSELMYLSCSYNRMKQLDLTGHDKLIALNCEMNQLTSLNLSGCTQLLSLYCRNNLLTELDLTDNSKLEFIETFSNSLTSIDVRHLQQLRFLHIDHNKLTELDMSQNTNLEGGGFVARNNFVEKIFLPTQPGLTIYLDDYGEQDPINGYDQVAWYLDPSFTEPAPETMEAQGQTLYSQRIPNRYTIYFSANGGTGSMPGISATWDSPVQLPTNTFRRYGYTFVQWSSLPNEDYLTHQDEEEVSNLAGKTTDGDRITLYARWAPNRYTIQLDPNGGEGEVKTIEATYTQYLNLPANDFTKDGKEFAGWATTQNGYVRYLDQAQVQGLTAQADGVVTLYAVWKTPISELQKPYLEELETAFGGYESSEYTTQDWNALADAYAEAAKNIRAAENTSSMSSAMNAGIEAMKEIPKIQQRVGDVTSAWESSNAQALSFLHTKDLSEANAQQANDAATTALKTLEQEQLGAFCPLENPEDKSLVVGQASVELQSVSDELMNLQQAAHWLAALDGLSTRTMTEVQEEHLSDYQNAISHYNTLESSITDYISPSVLQGLQERYELAGQKKSDILALQNAYDALDKEEYSATGRDSLKQELNKGLAAVRSAASVDQAEQARKTALERINQVPKADQEPTTPPSGGDGGSTGGGSTGGGSTGGGSTGGGSTGGGSTGGGSTGGGSTGGGGTISPEIPSNNTTSTIKDETTGAYATVTTTKDGHVSADVTVPDGISHTVIRIPYSGSAGTVAVQVMEDGTKRTVLNSFYQAGMFTVRLEQSAHIELVDASKQFSDVMAEDWYSDSVQFVASRELFSGIGKNTFAPDMPMDRAMLVTVLYRMEGCPVVSQGSHFQDVPDDIWYSQATIWAAEQGIVSGTGTGVFTPDAPITRESLAVMLYRSVGSPAPTAEEQEALTRFQDGAQISAWAQDAMAWAVAHGILNGDTQGNLMPNGNSTRAEVATMLTRFITWNTTTN
ncbi:S-layer homology domain-containing protein [Flavonifractor hominis]|uniref:S-layer homology domain-containing protein n=1 Tax=Flavonifractor hominis TaxID=3133178 RepID=A0ABV1EKM1_9FIRM